jgi:hypothetical protein
MRTKIGLMVLTFVFCMPAFAIDKKELEQRYKGKYLVVLREGISVGFRIAPSDKMRRFSGQGVRIDGERAELYTIHGPFEGALPPEERVGAVTSEPIHPGEILQIVARNEGVDCCPDDSVQVRAETVSLHSVTRGIGANEHESREVGMVELQFPIPNRKDYDAAAAIMDKWLKPFDTPGEAANFGKNLGNTASGAFVKEVKLGMSPAEVESVMGLPISKADLGEKMLYKYKDMTVEFHDGKVTDVR